MLHIFLLGISKIYFHPTFQYWVSSNVMFTTFLAQFLVYIYAWILVVRMWKKNWNTGSNSLPCNGFLNLCVCHNNVAHNIHGKKQLIRMSHLSMETDKMYIICTENSLYYYVRTIVRRLDDLRNSIIRFALLLLLLHCEVMHGVAVSFA